MSQTQLSDFVVKHGQERTARLLGVTQGAISKALKSARVIRVTEHPDGKYSAEELKPFPAQKTKAA